MQYNSWEVASQEERTHPHFYPLKGYSSLSVV